MKVKAGVLTGLCLYITPCAILKTCVQPVLSVSVLCKTYCEQILTKEWDQSHLVALKQLFCVWLLCSKPSFKVVVSIMPNKNWSF